MTRFINYIYDSTKLSSKCKPFGKNALQILPIGRPSKLKKNYSSKEVPVEGREIVVAALLQ